MKESSPSRNRLRFGVFEADLASRELRKNGNKIRLQDQPFQVLTLLLENRGQVVTREELRQKIWPADTFVDFDNSLNTAINKIREALGDSAEEPRFVETLPRRGYRFVALVEAAAPQVRSLAVLPLENLSGDPDQEYFTEGLTEALITTLTKIGALRVISRTSTMRYKNIDKGLPEIARELQADVVVEGTVFRSGNRVRVSVQLVDARTDAHIWAESYDRDLRDVLALQSEVAQAIMREVEVKLAPHERAQFSHARPVDSEAYVEYLKGRYYWNKRTAEGFAKGSQHFQYAIDKDPTYAPAYSGLSDCAGGAGFRGIVHPEEGCGKARSAAQKALEIDETAEAHASLGWAIMHFDFDFLAAEKEFQRAIELSPRYATAHQWYAHCLAYTGRLDQSVEASRRALQLDPLSLIINATHGGALWFQRQWDRDIEHCLKALELDPNFLTLRWTLAHVYQGKGMHERAISERKRAVELSGGAPLFIAELGGSYAAAGMKEEAVCIVEELRERSKRCYVMAYWVALIYAGLKEKDKAFNWLEKAYQERSAMLAFVKVDPRLDYLRSDPRYDGLIRRMKYPKV